MCYDTTSECVCELRQIAMCWISFGFSPLSSRLLWFNTTKTSFKSQGVSSSGSTTCNHGNNNCQHICVDDGLSHVCLCHDGYVLNADLATCSRKHWNPRLCVRIGVLQVWGDAVSLPGAEPCALGHECQHICIDADHSYVCRCRDGYVLNPDGKTCSRHVSDPSEVSGLSLFQAEEAGGQILLELRIWVLFVSNNN